MKYCVPDEIWNMMPPPGSNITETPVDRYLADMVYRLPSVTDELMTKVFWHSLVDFCSRTGAWQIIAFAENSSRIEVDVSGFMHFNSLEFDGKQIPTSAVSTGETGDKVFISRPIGDTPNMARTTYSYLPHTYVEPEERKAPFWFLDKYGKLIMNHALFTLQSMTGKSWYDPVSAQKLALDYKMEFSRLSRTLLTSGMRNQVLAGAENMYIPQPQGQGGE